MDITERLRKALVNDKLEQATATNPLPGEKPRKRFVVHYKDGTTRSGVMYIESNIMMDGTNELYARLDQLVNDDVAGILFP